MMERSQRGETVEALIWRVFQRSDVALLKQVLEDDRNYGRREIFERLTLEPGTQVYLPDVVPEPERKRLIRAAELWT